MVKKTKIVNKLGEVLKTKEKGEVLYDYRFEAGDIFIPCNNSVFSKTHEAVVKGEKKKITDYKLKCKVLGYQNEEDIFVTLTPTQAISLENKKKEEIILNQQLFQAYEYTAKDENKYIGVGIKAKKMPMKSFDEFSEILEEK